MSLHPVGTKVTIMSDEMLRGEVVGHGVMTGYAFNTHAEAVYLIRLDKGGYLNDRDMWVQTVVAHPDSVSNIVFDEYDGPYKASPGGY